MKLKLISICLVSFISVVTAKAQVIKIVEPEFAGNVVFVNDSIGNGITLEKQTSFIKSNGNASLYVTGIGKVKSSSIVKGNKSDVRINKKTNLMFIVRVTDNSIDPVSVINVFPLQQKADKRYVEVGSATTFSGTKANDIAFLQFKGKKYGTSSYLIEISNIEPGEYAITLPERRDIFSMFGVD
jgi:hypothetical protein